MDRPVFGHYYGCGLGWDILSAVGERAKSWGGCYVKLAVYDGNQDAISFYRHLGFELREDEQALILRDL